MNEEEARRKHAEARLKALADLVVGRATGMMAEFGVPPEMILDRMLTFAAVQAAAQNGSLHTAEIFRDLADKIDHGALYPATGEDHRGKGH